MCLHIHQPPLPQQLSEREAEHREQRAKYADELRRHVEDMEALDAAEKRASAAEGQLRAAQVGVCVALCCGGDGWIVYVLLCLESMYGSV